MKWKRRSLAKVVALDTWPEWTESLNPGAVAKRKARNIPVPIVAFVKIVLRLVALPAEVRAIAEALSHTKS
jgi:hypothetical protein